MNPGYIYRYGNIYTLSGNSSGYWSNTFVDTTFYGSKFPQEHQQQKQTPERMEKYKPTNKKELPCI